MTGFLQSYTTGQKHSDLTIDDTNKCCWSLLFMVVTGHTRQVTGLSYNRQRGITAVFEERVLLPGAHFEFF